MPEQLLPQLPPLLFQASLVLEPAQAWVADLVPERRRPCWAQRCNCTGEGGKQRRRRAALEVPIFLGTEGARHRVLHGAPFRMWVRSVAFQNQSLENVRSVRQNARFLFPFAPVHAHVCVCRSTNPNLTITSCIGGSNHGRDLLGFSRVKGVGGDCVQHHTMIDMQKMYIVFALFTFICW